MSEIFVSAEAEPPGDLEHIYTVHINTKSLRDVNHIKQRIKDQYMQHYRDKLNIHSLIRVKQPTQDHLANLTTKQLDYYIQLEKNRCEMERKKKSRQTGKKTAMSLPSVEPTLLGHGHIYQSSFLAKINRLVGAQPNLKDDTDNYRRKSQFYFNTPEESSRQSNITKSLNRPKKSVFGENTADKSVASIPCEIQNDEPVHKKANRRRHKTEESRPVQWFEGMSRLLIPEKHVKVQHILRGMDMDKSISRLTNSRFRVKTHLF